VSEPVWLIKQAVVAVHNQLIAAFGGTSGIHDEGLLDSALARPVNAYNYDDAPSLCSLAATYAGGIVQNHPFVDGNKRTGFMAAYVFLGRNGLRLTADELSATTMTLALATSEINEAEYAVWLQQSAAQRSE